MKVCIKSKVGLQHLIELLMALKEYSVDVTCSRGKCDSVIEGVDVNLLKWFNEVNTGILVLSKSECLPLLVPPRVSKGVKLESSSHYSVVEDLGSGSGAAIVFEAIDSSTVRLPLEAVWRHIGVFGSTGSGKSTTAAYIASSVSRLGSSVIVIDWHGEYEDILRKLGANQEVIGVNELPKLSLLPEGFPLDVAVDIVEEGLSLTQHQATALYEALEVLIQCLKGANTRRNGDSRGLVLRSIDTLQDGFDEKVCECIHAQDNSVRAFIKFIECYYDAEIGRDILLRARRNRLVSRSRAEIEVWAALIRRLRSIATSPHDKLFVIRGALDSISKILEPGKVTVLKVSEILSTRVRRLYSLLLLRSVFDYAATARRWLNTLIVVEEAHNLVVGGENSVLPQLLSEARKYGIGVLLVEQTPSILGPQILHNINTFIVHRMHGVSDVEALKMLIPGNIKDIGTRLSSLGVGEAILISAYMEKPIPIMIRFPG